MNVLTTKDPVLILAATSTEKHHSLN